ncbi:hypothetical protein HPB47_014173 [Ixodes persulcatus]|uniref:Uncharacterized protein n=1 Tax=Ixodes persulcatus TaxID=34615 RepID=A0AC60QWN3_IXOPE|nr:hypothetical protein HPB47_014173 [Ixodes persulcatus]
MIHEAGSAAQPSDASSMSDDSSIIMSDPDDNAGFTLVKSKRIRKRKHVSKESASSDDTIITTPSPGLTVVVKPADPSQIITKVNPLKLSEKLNDIAPDGVILIRPNYRLNLLAIDTRNTESKKTLLKMTTLCGMKITVYEAHQRSSAIGIIRGVSQEITEADLQWNARGLRNRLSDFRQLTFKYQFPVIAISESRVTRTLRLSGYEVFHSSRGRSPSRLLLAIRKDLTYVVHDVNPHPTNEYVAATISKDTTVLTVIAAYIEPRARFDKDILDELIKATPSPHILTGDFNAHHPLWGGVKTTVPGRSKLTHFVRSHYIGKLHKRKLEHSYSMSITLRGNLVEYQKSGRLHDHGKNDTVTTRMGPREQKDTSYMHVRIPPRKEQCRQCFRSSIHR